MEGRTLYKIVHIMDVHIIAHRVSYRGGGGRTGIPPPPPRILCHNNLVTMVLFQFTITKMLITSVAQSATCSCQNPPDSISRQPFFSNISWGGGACPQTPLEEHALHTVYFTCVSLLSPEKFPPPPVKNPV